MATFVDASGRRWTLALTVGRARRMRERGVDIYGIIARQLAPLSGDLPLLGEVLAGLAEGGDAGAMLDALAGNALGAAMAALTQTVTDFFPPPAGGDKKGREALTEEEADRRAMEIERDVWECAGACGIDPGQYTLRELAWAAGGRDKAGWEHTSAILAMIHNCNCADAKDRKPPAHFNPRAEKAAKHAGATVVPIAGLKHWFTGGK